MTPRTSTAGRTAVAAWLAAFEDRDGRATGEPAWLREIRHAAMARFASMGWPTSRDEAWKYTSLAPITSTSFDLDAADAGDLPAAGDPRGDAGDLPEDRLDEAVVRLPAAIRLVFVNGRYSTRLSSVGPLPAGIRIGSLAGALFTEPEIVRSFLARPGALDEAGACSLLNAAWWRDGVVCDVTPGVRLETPIHALFITAGAGRRLVDHPRSLIQLGPGSRATFVESALALTGEPSLTNAVTQIALGAGAELDHYAVGLTGPQAFRVAETETRQGEGSRLSSCAVVLGGSLTRREMRVRLEAETAACTLSGLSVLGGRQHADQSTVVDHAAPRATSRQLFKAILDGHARSVFNGRVIVRPGANGTDAYQTNKNLLLADGVEADSKPQLEIYADDVKCSHGAADGQVAEDALFYLKSRGLGEDRARTLLTLGFAQEVLDRVRHPELRSWLERRLAERLHGGRVHEAEPPEVMAATPAAASAKEMS